MQNSFTVTAKFLGAKATETLGEKGFLKRSFYLDLTDNPEYPCTPEFQLTGDKVNLVDNLQKGQMLQVKFSIDGRKFTNKEGKEGVITNLRVWKIDVVQMQSAAVAPARPASAPAPAASGPGAYRQPASAPAQPAVAAGFESDDPNNDLPF